MTPNLVLAGGGPGALLALRRHFKAALALAAPRGKRPVVAYVGAASNDSVGFFRMVTAGLAATGARFVMARLARARDKASEARAVLEDADLVFMSGGDVDQGMRVLEDRDAAAPLRKMARQGKPLFGVSAGSLMLAREWVRFPEENDDTKAELFPCLGIAPVHVDAHSEDDGWSELRVLVSLLHARGDRSPVGHGLTRKGALLVDTRSGDFSPLGTDIPRLVVRRGHVIEGPALRV